MKTKAMHGSVIPPSQQFGERRIGRFNWLGVWTLYLKEVKRFMKITIQTIFAPAVNTLLFLAIFILAFSDAGRGVAGVPFAEFLVAGLIVMTVFQNAFANTSSSLMSAKVQGNIVDILMPPLSPGELTLALALGGVSRGVACALALAPAILIFVDYRIAHWWAVLYFGFSAALMLSLAGVATAIWADKFDHLATITNFVIMPLTFLSGTFYSVERLPEMWRALNVFNPFFYIIDGFRYGFIDYHDSVLWVGALFALGMNAALWTLCHRMFRRGYKIKA